MKKILVAGGAGFLGSHLTELLVSREHDVTVVDDFSSGRRTNLSNVESKVKLIHSNVCDLNYDRPIHAVINLASRASRNEWETFPVDVALANSTGSDKLIKLSIKNHARYVYASSSEIYGDPEVIPTPESYVGRVDSLGPRSPYVESKRFGETLVSSYVKQHALDGIILRLFNTYGPRMRAGDLYGRVVDRFVKQALKADPLTIYGDGKQTRAFAYVSDVVEGIAKLIEDGISGEVYNIGSSTETAIIDLARLVIKTAESKSSLEFRPLPKDDPKRRAADITKAEAVGWKPRVGLREGLGLMVEQTR